MDAAEITDVDVILLSGLFYYSAAVAAAMPLVMDVATAVAATTITASGLSYFFSAVAVDAVTAMAMAASSKKHLITE